MKKVQELKRKASEKLSAAKAIQEGAADGVMSAEQEKEYDALVAEATRLNDQANRVAAAEELEQGLTAGRGALRGLATGVETVRERFLEDPARGFGSHRAFLAAVMDVEQGEPDDERLKSLATRTGEGRNAERCYALPRAFAPAQYAAGGDEQSTVSDPHGGLTVPTQQGGMMPQITWQGDPTSGRTTMVPMTAPSIKMFARVDKDHSSSVSGGLTVGRRIETQTVAASRMTLEEILLKAEAMMGIAYVTEELLTDSPLSFIALLEQGFDDEFAAAVLEEKLNGGGTAGEMLGVMNSPALITVAAQSGQSADTIVFLNLAKMAARIWGQNPIWLYNPDCEVQLRSMTDAAGQFVWQGRLTEDAPDMIFGKPAIKCDWCATVGDLGDIILCDWSQYLEAVYQAVVGASSIHVRFLNNERTFRFLMRNCGAPWWRSAFTPKRGATRSPFVALAARAG